MDVVDDAALLSQERAAVFDVAGWGFLKLIAKIGVGLLEIFPKTGLTAEASPTTKPKAAESTPISRR